MADYFTQFSTMLDLGDPDKISKAFDLLGQPKHWHPDYDPADPDAELPEGFQMEDQGEGELWLHDGSGYGLPGNLVSYVLLLADALDLQGCWGFAYAETCSKARPDGFGGGAIVLDLTQRTELASFDAQSWLAEYQPPKEEG